MAAANGAKHSNMPANEIVNVVTDPIRWAILNCLVTDKTAKQIGEAVGIKQALAQYHAKILVKAGVLDEFEMPMHRGRFVYSRRDVIALINIAADKSPDAKVSVK